MAPNRESPDCPTSPKGRKQQPGGPEKIVLAPDLCKPNTHEP